MFELKFALVPIAIMLFLAGAFFFTNGSKANYKLARNFGLFCLLACAIAAASYFVLP